MHSSKEFLVGCFVLLALVSAGVFLWLLGGLGRFHSPARFHVRYGFAGGVEVGSPVRVAGVKVGRVERITFLPPDAADPSVSIEIELSVAPYALELVRQDSRFFVNMAGVIGERYVEISPGGAGTSVLNPGSRVRGVDPPRIDQLLSQGYGVFGRIQEFLERNEKAVTEALESVSQLLVDFNRALKAGDHKRVFALVNNLNEVAVELKSMARKAGDPQTKQMFDRLNTLLERAVAVDRQVLEEFLQKQGIRARIF